MGKMKTVFTLKYGYGYKDDRRGTIQIVKGEQVSVRALVNSSDLISTMCGWLTEKDAEHLAVNILKALGSKKLKP